MAKSGGQQKAKKSEGKAKRAKRAGGEEPYEVDDLIRALNHRLRRQILRLLHSSRRPLSPTLIEETLELGDHNEHKLSTVSYHVGVLAGFKAIFLVDEQPVRGAMEHFYASAVSDTAWVRSLLKRTLKSDEAQLWPKGRGKNGKRAAKKKGR